MIVDFAFKHPIPPENASGKWWMYVLGTAALFGLLFIDGGHGVEPARHHLVAGGRGIEPGEGAREVAFQHTFDTVAPQPGRPSAMPDAAVREAQYLLNRIGQ